jgi:hypothetical protein
MHWSDVSDEARITMKELGDFVPTIREDQREIKGYIDGKCYYTSDELRRMAIHFIEVADWLDKRAAIAECKK